ncbi:iron-containing alcohol dehydrogenase [Paenibacillus koleovorans]|uniref:iron-containing alcohol dehydrogenase n=1 Tax=Paenibacillus koleovorans TaxID=121608 RepID=UPI000FD7F6B3|nr:iron-containing alcohol dehydrogenase [Paenibacillus koleovorans]
MQGAILKFPPLSYVGRGASSRLAEEVRRYEAGRVLLIADQALVKLGMTERLAAPIRQGGVTLDVFAEIEPEPSLALAERIVAHAREGRYDLIIGLGGGSALDLAKLAAVLSAHEGAVADYLNLTGDRRIERRGLPKLLVPTTSGSGSEVTNIAVLSLAHTKDVVVHEYLSAEAAIVDAELTVSVPARVTAATGMDAMTHAIEAYLSIHASPASDALALNAVRLGGRAIRQAVRDGRDVSAREDMSQASYLAGLAFFNAGVAGVHALAYPLGGQFHMPHGEANAVLLPHVMARLAPACGERMRALLRALQGDSATGADDHIEAGAAADAFVAALHALSRDVGLSVSLRDYGISESELDALTDDAGRQTRLLARSPLALERADIRAIYAAAWQGRD